MKQANASYWRTGRCAVLAGLCWMSGAARAQDNSQSGPADAATSTSTSTSTDASADQSGNDTGGWLSNIGFNFGGFIRPEAALHTSQQENPNNERGNPYNSISVARQAYVPPAAAGLFGITTPITWSSVPVPAGVPGTMDTVQRPIPPSNNVFNLHILRAEGDMGVRFGNDLKLVAHVRAIGDFGHYSDFRGESVDDQINGGISGGNPALYGGAPNYFQYLVDGKNHPNPLELAGPNYMAYFSSLFLDYNHGPLNVRLGNQSIAWGQAIFFRVLDVPDGLDLRRHSVLDYAQEEFSDKRVPAPALRLGYQINDAVLLDGYVQKFQPTVLGNPNTQYNIIPTQFTVHDRYAENDDDNQLSYGLRMKANFGQWGFQAIAVHRYNPDGVYRWTNSGVAKNLPATTSGGVTNTLGLAVNAANAAAPSGGAGTALSTSPFEASPGGVYSAAEWFHYASMVRLDGIQGLNAAINDFPTTAYLTASPVSNYTQAVNELNTFFLASGGDLRGHIERDYFHEDNFGGGVSYVTEGAPGSVLDQIIINLETTYTPARVFTSPTLGKNFLPQNDWVSALVMEKYYRFSQSFPATYFVLQYMHRTRDDLFGRALRGYGGGDSYGPNTVSAVPGVTNANYVAFAFQQPLPQDIYRIGFATLYDPRGGILVQPGLQYKPSGHWAVDGFYNYINDRLSGNPNNNVFGGLAFANEFTLRVAYQF